MARLSANVSVVMLAPKTTSSGAQLKKSAMASMRLLDNQVGALAGEERSAEVGVPLRQVFRDGVDHLLRDLRAAGRVEEHRGLAVDRLAQRRKLLAHPLDIEFAYLGGDSCTG